VEAVFDQYFNTFSLYLAYDDRQKAKRKSIEERPLFSVDDKPMSASSTNISSSSSSSSGSDNRRKMATLTHIRQLTDATIARRRVAAFDTSSMLKTTNKITTNKLPINVKMKPSLSTTITHIRRHKLNTAATTTSEGSSDPCITDDSTLVNQQFNIKSYVRQSVVPNSTVQTSYLPNNDTPVIGVFTPGSALSSLAGEYDETTSSSSLDMD